MDISGYEGHREIGDVGVAAKGVESRCCGCCRCISVGMGFPLDPVSVLLEGTIWRLWALMLFISLYHVMSFVGHCHAHSTLA